MNFLRYYAEDLIEDKIISMNIFILDKRIDKCARYHCDKHVIKMILEYTQILCTVANLNGIKTPYKSTHIRHPSVIWAGKTMQNWLWLKKLLFKLHEEYQYRYGSNKIHSAFKVGKSLKTPKLAKDGLTPFVQCMPDKFKLSENPIQAYRNFYINRKNSFATWTRRKTPKWYVIKTCRHI